VDVPAIDAVLFADPRQSKIDIVQAAGRAMRRFEGKKLGYIIVPVIMDEDSDEPSDDAFDQIIAVLSALAMEDERIIEEFRSIASGRRSGGATIVEIDAPEYVRMEFGDLIENIETRIWDRLGFGWEKGLERLKAYVAKTNDAKVPQLFIDETGFRLGTWVQNRRAFYRRGTLSKDRIATLEALPGWRWDVVSDLFSDGLARLQLYVAERGNARVEASYEDQTGFKLGRWLIERRSDYRKGKLQPERIAALEDLSGWTWNTRV
jgi:hypothetical protein